MRRTKLGDGLGGSLAEYKVSTRISGILSMWNQAVFKLGNMESVIEIWMGLNHLTKLQSHSLNARVRHVIAATRDSSSMKAFPTTEMMYHLIQCANI